METKQYNGKKHASLRSYEKEWLKANRGNYGPAEMARLTGIGINRIKKYFTRLNSQTNERPQCKGLFQVEGHSDWIF